MIQLTDAQSLPQIALRDVASQSGSVPIGDGKVLFSAATEKFIWSTEKVFSHGELGAWYSPSDSATLFQDAAGTTPAGVGDPVGLMLDKSQLGGKSVSDFLAGQAELVTNGDFSTGDLTGFDFTAGKVSVNSNNQAVLVTNDTQDAVLEISNPQMLPGRTYVCSVDLVSSSGTLTLIRIWNPTDGYLVNAYLPDGHHEFILSVNGTGTRFYALQANNTAGQSVVDNFSIKELPGHHANQATSNSRPTLQEDANGNRYLSFDGVDDVLISAAGILGGCSEVTTISGLYANSAATSVYLQLGDIYNSPGSFYAANEGGVNANVGGSGYRVTQGALSAVGSPRVASTVHRRDGTYPEVYVDRSGPGAPKNTAGEVTGLFFAGTMKIGARNASAFQMNGRLYDVLVIGRVLSGNERSMIEAEFAARAGVAL